MSALIPHRCSICGKNAEQVQGVVQLNQGVVLLQGEAFQYICRKCWKPVETYIGVMREMVEHARTFAPQPGSEEVKPAWEGILANSVHDLEIGKRARTGLQLLKIHTIGELVEKTADELMAQKGLKGQALRDIRSALAHKGLKLKGE